MEQEIPWSVPARRPFEVWDANGNAVASVFGRNQEDRARLIAAAPDMLALLDDVRDFIKTSMVRHHPTARDFMARAEAIVTKIEGAA